MHFAGRIFIDFDTQDVWRLYSTALRASGDGRATVDVTWEEFLVDDPPRGDPPAVIRMLGACAVVRNDHPEQHQRFVQALMTLIYQEKDDPRRDTTLLVASRVAGIEGSEVVAGAIDPGLELLVAHSETVRELGVMAVPSIMDTGPAVWVQMSGAAGRSDPVGTLELISQMMRNDGVWGLTKPR